MNNEVESFPGELKTLREENRTLKEKLKFYETEIAWSTHNSSQDPEYVVDWDLHSVFINRKMSDMS